MIQQYWMHDQHMPFYCPCRFSGWLFFFNFGKSSVFFQFQIEKDIFTASSLAHFAWQIQKSIWSDFTDFIAIPLTVFFELIVFKIKKVR